MPAPATATYAAATIVSAHTEVLSDIDAGAGAGKIRLFDDSDTLLCEITLTEPAGTVNGTTGALTLTPDGAGTAVATGTCTYGAITDSNNNAVVTIPAEAGGSAVSGKIVINSLSINSGAEVTVSSAVIG